MRQKFKYKFNWQTNLYRLINLHEPSQVKGKRQSQHGPSQQAGLKPSPQATKPKQASIKVKPQQPIKKLQKAHQ
jgi:hypothetical protein